MRTKHTRNVYHADISRARHNRDYYGDPLCVGELYRIRQRKGLYRLTFAGPTHSKLVHVSGGRGGPPHTTKQIEIDNRWLKKHKLDFTND